MNKKNDHINKLIMKEGNDKKRYLNNYASFMISLWFIKYVRL